MSRLVLLPLVSILVAIAAVSAQADVEVGPDPGQPGVILDGDRIVAPPESPESGTTPITSPDPIDTYCEPDVGGVIQCLPRTPDQDDVPSARPEPTEGDILRATREIGLPSLTVKIQPGETTLVNVPTIFHAEPRPFERSVTLLGFDVDLVATPITFHWVHGDGTSQDTSTPGKPYPALDVTHSYLRPADDVMARVDVTYRVQYRVNGQAWQTLNETITASGPVAELDVDEAAPVLTKP